MSNDANGSNVVQLRTSAIKNVGMSDDVSDAILIDQPPTVAEPEVVSASFELSSSAQVLDYEMYRDEGVTGIMTIPQLSKFFTQVMKKEDWKRHVFNTEGSQKSTFLYSVRIPKTRHASGVLPRVNVYVAAKGITTPETNGITLLVDGLTNVAHSPDDMHTVSVDITSRPDLYILHHNDGSVEVQILSLCGDAPLEIRGTTPDICITIRP